MPKLSSSICPANPNTGSIPQIGPASTPKVVAEHSRCLEDHRIGDPYRTEKSKRPQGAPEGQPFNQATVTQPTTQ